MCVIHIYINIDKNLYKSQPVLSKRLCYLTDNDNNITHKIPF